MEKLADEALANFARQTPAFINTLQHLPAEPEGCPDGLPPDDPSYPAWLAEPEPDQSPLLHNGEPM